MNNERIIGITGSPEQIVYPVIEASNESRIEPQDWTYEDIVVGASCSFERSFSREDGIIFSRLSGDSNPLHLDEPYGAASQFGQNIIHGMFAASAFSALVGMYCPGRRSLYLSQSLNFHLPIFYGDAVTVRGTVMSKVDAFRIVTLKTEIIRSGQVAIEGIARTVVLEKLP
jgi:3-hydroxybutyryl-CoA dehydratase